MKERARIAVTLVVIAANLIAVCGLDSAAVLPPFIIALCVVGVVLS